MSTIGTLVYVFKKGKILLGSKKYGKAKGKLNGYGGKVEATDKSMEAAALRELKEETGLIVGKIELHGVLNMKWEEEDVKIFLFRAYNIENEPKESNEMTVEWFDIKNIPKERMWESDRYWFDLVLQDRKFVANLQFDKSDSDLLKKMMIEFVDSSKELLEQT